MRYGVIHKMLNRELCIQMRQSSYLRGEKGWIKTSVLSMWEYLGTRKRTKVGQSTIIMTNATFWVLTYSFNIALMRCCILWCCLSRYVGTPYTRPLTTSFVNTRACDQKYNGTKSGTQINVEKEEKNREKKKKAGYWLRVFFVVIS